MDLASETQFKKNIYFSVRNDFQIFYYSVV